MGGQSTVQPTIEDPTIDSPVQPTIEDPTIDSPVQPMIDESTIEEPMPHSVNPANQPLTFYTVEGASERGKRKLIDSAPLAGDTATT